jgi:hypothetical protein
MIRLDDLENLILDLTCEELKKARNYLNNIHSDEILFNFRQKKILKLSAIWRMKENDGSREYAALESSVFF